MAELPVCDACGKRHSANCDIVDYAGAKFNVCGECLPEVKENPADFLAGKKGTSTEQQDFDVCGPNK
jgi:ribosome-binding protein aMBF1 (putative translation factor)